MLIIEKKIFFHVIADSKKSFLLWVKNVFVLFTVYLFPDYIKNITLKMFLFFSDRNGVQNHQYIW